MYNVNIEDVNIATQTLTSTYSLIEYTYNKVSAQFNVMRTPVHRKYNVIHFVS